MNLYHALLLFIFVSRKFMLKFFYFKQYLQTLCAVHDLIVQSSYSNHLRPIFLCLLQSWDWLCLSYSILSWNFEKYTLKHGFIFHIYNDWKIKSTINFRISCNISTLPSFLTLPYRFFLFRCSIDMLRRIHPGRPFIGKILSLLIRINNFQTQLIYFYDCHICSLNEF